MYFVLVLQEREESMADNGTKRSRNKDALLLSDHANGGAAADTDGGARKSSRRTDRALETKRGSRK